MKFYALYDTQLGGFKASESYESYEEATEGALNRIESIHQDFLFDDDEEVADTFEQYRDMHKQSDESFISLFDYEIKEVTESEHVIISESTSYGLLTSVAL